MNRLKTLLGQSPDPERPDDYYEIEWKYKHFAVDRRTAEDVARRLSEDPPPKWIVFRDLNGSRHRVVAKKISRISESTVSQRQAEREFDRARREEDRRDRRPWEDDDNL
jgi:hypothetical protein